MSPHLMAMAACVEVAAAVAALPTAVKSVPVTAAGSLLVAAAILWLPFRPHPLELGGHGGSQELVHALP